MMGGATSLISFAGHIGARRAHCATRHALR
ncbi:hypothetical protein P3T21_003881 [Paraburkholderia sp. GAS334]